jgi:hypothetical protein
MSNKRTGVCVCKSKKEREREGVCMFKKEMKIILLFSINFL